MMAANSRNQLHGKLLGDTADNGSTSGTGSTSSASGTTANSSTNSTNSTHSTSSANITHDTGSTTDTDIVPRYMQKALNLAQLGAGFTNPNPLVGAVIVKSGRIIGEGYHRRCGGPHAEIEALNNSSEPVRGAAMYVTLEPCTHFGKTPPCTDEIIKQGIQTVVISLQDPNPVVSGKGIAALREHGIRVITGICETESRRQNEVFIKYISTKLPFCIMKTAMTLDGKIASVTGDAKWISNEASRESVHILRQRMSSVMIGVETLIHDNPQLTVRTSQIKEVSNPIRVIVDTKGRTPLSAAVFQTDLREKTDLRGETDLREKNDLRGETGPREKNDLRGETGPREKNNPASPVNIGQIIIATTERAPAEKVAAFKKLGARVLILPLRDNRVDLRALMYELGRLGIDSVLLEGGAELSFSALAAGLVDKVQAYIAPKIIGGRAAKTAVGGAGIALLKNALLLKDIQVRNFGDDLMIEGYIISKEKLKEHKEEHKQCLPV